METDMHQQNKEVYSDYQVIKEYIDQEYLFPPEQTVLDILQPRLHDFTMLDIAVGAGRTTHFFAPLVKRYVAIDYSQEMIELCQKKFHAANNDLAFHLADMRTLDMFADNTFDFVLISYNAISTLPHEDRLSTFAEIKRVGKPGGYFFFSAHNLQWVARELLSLKRKISVLHPKITYWNLLRLVKAYAHNDWTVITHLQALPYAIINDGAHDFKLLHYYIRPAEQIKQLAAYFTTIRVFARDGHELKANDLNSNTDGFLHYLCNFT